MHDAEAAAAIPTEVIRPCRSHEVGVMQRSDERGQVGAECAPVLHRGLAPARPSIQR